MNTLVTSKEEILETSRDLIRQRGWPAMNIRSLAGACGISVGSIYNYFESKDELMVAIVEGVWQEIFLPSRFEEGFSDTLACIRWLYERIELGAKAYPGLSTQHPLVFALSDRPDGKKRMIETWKQLLDGLCGVLRKDPHIRPGAFTETFTEEAFADLLFSLMLAAFLRENFDCAPVLELVRRTIY